MRAKKPTGFKENPAYSTGMTGQSSGRGSWLPRTCARAPRLPAQGGDPLTSTSAGHLRRGVGSGSHLLRAARLARTASPTGACSRTPHVARHSTKDPRYPTGSPNSLSTSGLTTFQVRAADASVRRCASDSRRSSVGTARHALPYRLPGPRGSGRMSTSKTELEVPSMSRSRRKQKMCWWYGAYSCGPIIVPCREDRPGSSAPVSMIPVSFTSSWSDPSWYEVPEEAVVVRGRRWPRC